MIQTTASSAGSPSSLTTTARRRRAILGVIGVAMLLVSASVASLNVALGAIAVDTGATATQQTWLVDAYAVALAAVLLPAGALGDRRGRRRMLLAGFTGFAVASVAAALVDDAGLLIALRAAAGLAAAAMMPATLAIITTVFPDDERGAAIGVWTGLAGAGGVLGLLGSGALLEVADWPAIFWLTAAIAVVGALATLAVVPETRAPRPKAADPIGALTSAAGFGLLVFATIEGGHRGWTAPATLAAAAAGAAALGLFVAIERRHPSPMLDVRVFADRRLSAGSLSIFFQFFANFGVLFASLQYLTQVKGYGTLQAAASLLPMIAGVLGLSPLADRLAGRYGPRAVGGGALLVLAAGVGGLALTGVHTPYAGFAAAIAAIGAGMGLAAPLATAWIVSALPAEEQGVASAINDTTREVGGALGIAVVGSLVAQGFRDGMAGVGDAASGSLATTLAAADRIPGGAALAERARTAWTDGQTTAMLVAAGLLLVAALATVLLHPGETGPGPDARPVPI